MRLLFLHLCLAAGLLGATEFHVSPSGNDGNPGTEARPFASIEKARDAVRKHRVDAPTSKETVTVWLQPGVYALTRGLEFDHLDSGTSSSPVAYRARVQGAARLHAGVSVAGSAFKAVTDPALLARMDANARGKILQLDLRPLKVQHAKKWSDNFRGGGNLFEFFCNDQRMPLSRWPNEGFTTMGKVLDKGELRDGGRGGRFVAREDRIARWNVASGVWLEGYWRVPWTPVVLRVASIEPATRTVTFAEGSKEGIGSKYARPPELGDGKENWCALNLLEEIDMPGEWSIDFDAQTLYFWPPADLAGASLYFSDLDKPLITIKDCALLSLQGLTVEGGLGGGVEISGGAGVEIAGCTFRNLGGKGVVVRGGTGHRVVSSDLYALGEGGIYLSGGERKTLTPAGHLAENNHLHHLGVRVKTYAAALHLGAYGGEAVGCRAAHNLIHDLPHAGVLYGGNDNVIEFNEVYQVVLTSGDMGAFYTWNDWTSQGNVVRYNFVHDSPRANAFYMDDGDSGDTIFGNVIYKFGYGPFVGGGHDNIIQNNLIIETERALHFDSRGIARKYQDNPGMLKRLQSVDVKSPPWSTKYPTLARLLDGRRDLPWGDVFSHNVAVRCKQLVNTSGAKDDFAHSTVTDNLELKDEDPGFVDAANLNFQLRQDSVIYKKMPAFKPIPFEQIGLVRDAWRKELPARSALKDAGSKSGNFDSNVDIQHDKRKQ